ncbi:LOW QUALITY PROTEIN: hypothetical protein U9M48_000121, partial [Paspalum notatum var. saurae]
MQPKWDTDGLLEMEKELGFGKIIGWAPQQSKYWSLYRYVNEKNQSVADLWDGVNLKCTFRRMGDVNSMEEICQLASTISFNEEDDALVWTFTSKGIYSVQSLYKVEFRLFLCAIRDLKIPPRVQYHLWLMSKNRLLTRDNLNKRKKVEDLTVSSVKNRDRAPPFFDCVVVKQLMRTLWQSMTILFHKTAAMILNWELLCPSEKKEELRRMAMRIKKEAAQ